MCGRYRRTTQEEELARLYHIPIPKQTDLPISYNIAPSQKVLTIRFNPETQQRSLDALQWGLIPYWAKDPKIEYKTINARVETVDTAPGHVLEHSLAALSKTPRRAGSYAVVVFPAGQFGSGEVGRTALGGSKSGW